MKNKRRSAYKDFTIGKYMIVWGVAAKGTCWFDNLRGTVRKDYLLSFTRTFHRRENIYLYGLHIGRLGIKWGKLA